jgi:hypothetical protein
MHADTCKFYTEHSIFVKQKKLNIISKNFKIKEICTSGNHTQKFVALPISSLDYVRRNRCLEHFFPKLFSMEFGNLEEASDYRHLNIPRT